MEREIHFSNTIVKSNPMLQHINLVSPQTYYVFILRRNVFMQRLIIVHIWVRINKHWRILFIFCQKSIFSNFRIIKFSQSQVILSIHKFESVEVSFPFYEILIWSHVVSALYLRLVWNLREVQIVADPNSSVLIWFHNWILSNACWSSGKTLMIIQHFLYSGHQVSSRCLFKIVNEVRHRLVFI